MQHSFCKRTAVRLAAFGTALTVLLGAASCGVTGGNAGEGKSAASMTELSPEELPQTLVGFLTTFTDWYIMFNGETRSYYSANAGDGSTNILWSIVGNMPCVKWEEYPFPMYELVWDSQRPDPKNWAKSYGGCYMIFDRAGADWIAKNIFNVTGQDIASMVRQGEENGWFYEYGDHYYTPAGGAGYPMTEYTVTKVTTDGRRYYVNYKSVFTADAYVPVDDALHYAELELKTIDGKEYWSLYKYVQTSNQLS